KIEALNDNKDRFLIGAFTAMRYGDYSGLENLKHTDKFITKRTKKTGIKVVIPMHWVIREILIRRKNILPVAVSNQKLNDALKELGQLADFTGKVEITVTRGGKQETIRRPKYELITTHTARRSGCTNMYLAGIDIYTIMGFSGHTTEKSFRKYIKIKQEENAQRFLEHPFFKKS
ncbi:MAG: tyrosine-type recombinase/integrase, partial [Bacteroidales bacterium]|nr:tyrosine-type recombinase/integrase [Bacteroidales bacterium]